MRRAPSLLLSLAALAATAASAAAQRETPAALAWTRGATCYEVFVRSFQDSDGDGVGDLRGLVSRLDYINDGDPRTTGDLGARCIWLMPIAESPSYHGYDVTDYYRVDREYGTNDDFKRLMAEAHRRGIRVLLDMVINHASSEHPWFQAALRDTTSPYRAWFRWSREPGPKNQWGNSNWHRNPHRDEYYYGFFWSGMPDLNYESPAVMEEMKRVATYWIREMGADGFRLDAVRHLYERGTQTENVPETHGALRAFADHVRGLAPGAFTIGEVWEPLDVLMRYYPDQLDGYFAFEVADSIVSAARSGSARGLFTPVLRLQERLPAYRWSPFLRNHDQPRARTELAGDMARARVASFLLLTVPGLPFVYYGEEIGMTGAKPDERLRTPMQWTAGPGAGFTTGTPWQRRADDSLTHTVEAQERDPASLLALHRRLIHLRAEHPALQSDALTPLRASHDAVAAFVRRDGERAVLVVANLGDAPLPGVRLASPAGALPAGPWRLRDLLGNASAAPLSVPADGAMREYVPLPSLAPRQGYLFDLGRAIPVTKGAPQR
ncbi:MAG TPA: alpha-amylase family glycosyl hydrolase [Gemmatimonadaceae bacterium]|nr:alpha-amylase family glycosyl hydrolase [Gemmatimonadaceae bacterium]